MKQIRDLLIGPKEPDLKNVGWVSFDKKTQKYELKFYINGRWLPIVSNIDTIEPEKIEKIKELIELINNNGGVTDILATIESLRGELNREIDARVTTDKDTRSKGVLFGGFSNRQTTANEVVIGYKNIDQKYEGTFSIPTATTTSAGVMTAKDKVKLNASIKYVEVSPNTNDVELDLEDNMNRTTHVVFPEATTEKAGVMSAEDKTALEKTASADDFEFYASKDTVTLEISTKSGNISNIELPTVTTEKAGVMSAVDKVALENVNSVINIGEYPNIQAVWDACKQIALNNPEISIIKYSVKAGITYNRGVVFQSYHYNDSLITQYYLYGGGQKHECNVRHIVTNGTTDKWQPMQIFTSYKFENGTLYGYKYGESESEQNKIEIVKINNATLSRPGLLSPEDKSKLGRFAELGESCDLNTYMTSGVYLIQTGSNEAKNYPIQTPVNSVLRLTVTDSYDGNTHVIVQVLNVNNHVGGEGGIYIRSCQNEEWKPWAKLQTNVEVGLIDQTKMDDLTDNGIYSGILSTTGETFVIICINNYAIAQQVGVHHISHLKYSLVAGTGEVKIEKRTRDAYGFWTEWENIGSSSILREATDEILGGVKLGTLNHISRDKFAPLIKIDSSYGNGVGISIDSGHFHRESGSLCIRLDSSMQSNNSVGIRLGDYNVYGNVIPCVLGSDIIGAIPNGMKSLAVGIPYNPEQFTLASNGLNLKDDIGSGVTKVTWNANSNMNDFKTPGVYDIYGERTVDTDNLPISNTGGGHSIAARLTVVASTLQPANNEICVTQFLQLSNRVGGDGASYVRTYNKNNNGMHGWSPWQKQMGMVETYMNGDNYGFGFGKESDGIDSGVGLYYFIDNGIYSGIYVDDKYILGQSNTPSFIETFVLVVINDYAASGQAGLPRHITQLKYAVDAITGQSTVKKRVGTGDDTISWSDWEDIGGGGPQEVDVTDSIKTSGLPTLVSQKLVKEGITYVVNFSNDDLKKSKIILDVNNKLSNFFKDKYTTNFGNGKIKFNCYNVYSMASSPSLAITGSLISDLGKWDFYVYDIDGLAKVSENMTTL